MYNIARVGFSKSLQYCQTKVVALLLFGYILCEVTVLSPKDCTYMGSGWEKEEKSSSGDTKKQLKEREIRNAVQNNERGTGTL